MLHANIGAFSRHHILPTSLRPHETWNPSHSSSPTTVLKISDRFSETAMLSILRWRWRFFIIFVCVWLRWRWRLCMIACDCIKMTMTSVSVIARWRMRGKGKMQSRSPGRVVPAVLASRSTNTCYNTAYTNTNTQRQKYKYKGQGQVCHTVFKQYLFNISQHFNILLQFHTSLQYLNILRLQVRYVQLQYDVHHNLSRPYNWRPYPTRP